MSNPDNTPAGWNCETLRELMKECDRRYEQRFTSMDEAVRLARAEAEKAKALAVAEADKSKGSINIAAALAFISLAVTLWGKFG